MGCAVVQSRCAKKVIVDRKVRLLYHSTRSGFRRLFSEEFPSHLRGKVWSWEINFQPQEKVLKMSELHFDFRDVFRGKLDISRSSRCRKPIPRRNCIGYSAVCFFLSPKSKTPKASFSLSREFQFIKVAKMCTGIPTSRIPVSYNSRIRIHVAPVFLRWGFLLFSAWSQGTGVVCLISFCSGLLTP